MGRQGGEKRVGWLRLCGLEIIAIEREMALPLLDGYRRSEIDVNVSSLRNAFDAPFATVAAEVGTVR